jgi:hypothetical protein
MKRTRGKTLDFVALHPGAIPRDERENKRTEGSQAAQETPQQAQATCKSQRARKPKRRN